MTLKIAWGITGCGDYLAESVDVMKILHKRHDLAVDVILSKAGEMVVTRYKLWDDIKQNFDRVFVEITPNAPFLIGPFNWENTTYC